MSALSGYWLARALDASIAGAMATMAGVIFGVVSLLAPDRGLIAIARRRRRQRWDFAQTMLAIHLFNHEGTLEAAHESRVDHLREHMRWDLTFARRVVRYAEQRGLLRDEGGVAGLDATKDDHRGAAGHCGLTACR